ncbi:MAG: leucyl/phenylalanyl-tRNA--protein transferase [Salibacteraceae bacterium]|nr:leucyl/phenylalanyl-tRNA--protein transferase [Salibacteraceae bacterium]MDP4762182.1 leucyl/phenylalanyl-tRNA--protein transferase [Salibacteraceae bacterium]MDP4843681.1 leucyl/phenylalanyl-tRNA--protein transferase [Salibacteraceae bacterium]
MPVYQLPSTLVFPSPEQADSSGLLAVGGDLSAERLLLAYENGIFPWFNDDQPILWWSPENRMVLYPDEFKQSKSLKQSIRNKQFEFKMDTAFDQVIGYCAKVPRADQDGTWITDEIRSAYANLHQMGFAHSFEIWQNNNLVGGLYGISLGRAFFGESMFSLVSDASKAAFYFLSEFAKKQDFHFVDCQLHTDHLASLGAKEIPRNQFLSELKTALAYPDLNQLWTQL